MAMFRGLAILALATLGTVTSATANSTRLFVATDGNDRWSGRLEKPASNGLDGPLATLTAALKTARSSRQNNDPAADDIHIFLRGGTHLLTEPVVIRPEDSGFSDKQPLTIAAWRNEKPVLGGGRRITGWAPVSGNPNLWSADVAGAREGKWYFRQLFVNGRRKQRARSPNNGFFQIDGNYLSDNPVQFKYRDANISNVWAADADVEVIGLQKWIDFRQPIVGVDEAARIVTLSGSVPPHTREANARYYIENTPDALDSPGEWYLDRRRGVVMYWPEPGEDLKNAEVIAPALTSELLRFEGDLARERSVQHVVLRGLTFAYTDWTTSTNGYTDTQAAVHIRGDVRAEGSVDCTIEECTFAHLGGYGVELGRGCQRFKVIENEFVDLGAGGIRIGEPARRQNSFEQNSGHLVADNHLHHLGRVYAPAVGIIVFQSGQNRIAHNHIHDLYYTAISVGWNWGYQETPCRDNIIEFNHLHHLGQGMLSDMGGVYTLGIQKGTVVRNNLIHDVNSHDYGGWGLYTDEGSTEMVLENNIVYRCKSAAFHQHYGRDNIIRNNILAFGREHQLMRTREEPHSSFAFEHNIVYFDSGDLLGGNWSDDHFKMDSNVYFDARGGASPAALTFKGATFSEWRKRGHDQHSVIADPLFVGPQHDDFRLKIDSPAFKLGFEPIDTASIGIRKKFRRRVQDTD